MGVAQTMYISPKSYTNGAKAADRVSYFAEVIRHELTHYAQFDMVTRTTPPIPKWFSEGLASYIGGQTRRLEDLMPTRTRGQSLMSFEDLQTAQYATTNLSFLYAQGYSVFDPSFAWS